MTTRTVRNDVERLRQMGYPVQATRGAVGGYRLSAGAAMPPLLLEDDEAVAVAVSLSTATGGAVEGLEETALRALTKLRQVLPPRLGRRVDALQSHTVRVPGQRRGPQVEGSLLALIAAVAQGPGDHAFLLPQPLRVWHRTPGQALSPGQLGTPLVPGRIRS